MERLTKENEGLEDYPPFEALGMFQCKELNWHALREDLCRLRKNSLSIVMFELRL